MMDKFKISNYFIVSLMSIMMFVVGIGMFLFFNNSSNVQVSLLTNNEQLHKYELMNEVLTHTILLQKDTITYMDSVLHKKDSIIHLLEVKIKKMETDTTRHH